MGPYKRYPQKWPWLVSLGQAAWLEILCNTVADLWVVGFVGSH